MPWWRPSKAPMSDVPSSTGWTDSAARRLLRNVFDAAVASADPGAAVLRHLPEKPKGRCVEILWIGVTAHPTAEWVANQLTQACGWEQIPRYLIRDRDGAYGEIFIRRVRSIGIRGRPTSARLPWQNGYAEGLIGSIRRECIDHVVVFGERHLRHAALVHELLQWHANPFVIGQGRADTTHCRDSRTHCLSPDLGGLHHQ
jgi:hypothetical protein